MKGELNVQGMLRFLIVVLAIVDVLLQGLRPRNVINLRHVVAVCLQSAKVLEMTLAYFF